MPAVVAARELVVVEAAVAPGVQAVVVELPLGAG